MSTDNRPALFSNKSLSLMAALVFLGSVLLAGSYLWFAASQQADAETRRLGHSLAKQTTFLIRPLILADDRISANHLLKELVELDYVSGMQLSDAREQVIARSGNNEGIHVQRRMMQHERQIGTLTLWLNPSTLQQALHKQLLLTMLFVLLSGSLTAIVLWYRCRAADATESQIPTDDFSQTLARAIPASTDTVPVDNNTPPSIGPTGPDPLVETSPEPDISVESDNAEADIAAALNEPDTTLTETTIELEEQPLTAKQAKENPLLKRGRDEEQLDLYSFEHEMELMLTAENAAYMLYIDATSAHTEYADAIEREELLKIYHQLANQVAHIYSGQLEINPNGDMQVLFSEPLEDDVHGVNALCSGLLFVLLYKGFNQQRIGQFKPVLNLHIALVRGHRGKPQILQEEARFLTRTTQSNELISHTALTEAPDIKQALLKDADIRREDEDKVLIHKVEKRYQTLFEKQSNHLLTKLKQHNDTRDNAH
ncbi:hypothetical protein [Pontibacterium sp.]|uniref:hypothetical protein n=1 Tax=Pontibacterium sp. TaxID=2036026 RepID=UPI003567F4B2